MTTPKRIFIDTSAWIELVLSGERYHQEVASHFQKRLKQKGFFFTNDYVLDEAWTRLVTQQGFYSTQALRVKTQEAASCGYLTILWTDEVLFANAWDTFERYSEHRFSFTDAVILTTVRELKIDEVISLDQGFKKVGCTVRPILS